MKSLDYVQQPDGSFLWEMVEMDEAARAPKPEPISDKPARPKRRTAVEETLSESASYEF